MDVVIVYFAYILYTDAGFFVFPDLSVRTEGSYRLKLSLFEVVA